MEKDPSMLLFFKRLSKKSSWRWRFRSSGFRLKRGSSTLHLWFVDNFLFKIVSVFEAIFLVSALCFFFLCCGCQF